jgi:hypothetical protein
MIMDSCFRSVSWGCGSISVSEAFVYTCTSFGAVGCESKGLQFACQGRTFVGKTRNIDLRRSRPTKIQDQIIKTLQKWHRPSFLLLVSTPNRNSRAKTDSHNRTKKKDASPKTDSVHVSAWNLCDPQNRSGAFLSRVQTSKTTRFVQNMLTCLHVVGSEHCRTV